MKKLRFFLLFLLMIVIGMPVSAENSDKVVDNADLLTDAEEEKLEELYTEIAEKYQCDVVVLTTDTLDGKSPMNYTDDYYEEHGYGYGDDISGIMLMVSMEDRDYWTATRGKAIQIFTDYGLRQIQQMFLEDLSEGEYYSAFRTFGSAAEAFIVEAEENQPYDVNHVYEEPMAMGMRILISCGLGLLAAIIVVAVLFSQLKSVRTKNQARAYVREGSFRLTRANDLFLYRTMTRRKIEKAVNSGGGGSSTHSTSGGGTAGGSGGKF